MDDRELLTRKAVVFTLSVGDYKISRMCRQPWRAFAATPDFGPDVDEAVRKQLVDDLQRDIIATLPSLVAGLIHKIRGEQPTTEDHLHCKYCHQDYHENLPHQCEVKGIEPDKVPVRCRDCGWTGVLHEVSLANDGVVRTYCPRCQREDITLPEQVMWAYRIEDPSHSQNQKSHPILTLGNTENITSSPLRDTMLDMGGCDE
jgi:predicted Zn-ribbon and HTH transcriptional regulator